MPNERRSYENFVTGTITDNPLGAGATAVNSAQLAALSDISATEHAVMVLDPFAEGTGPEIAWITAHGSGSTTATVVRGREGTTATAHVTGTKWAISPVASDWILKVATVADLPLGGGLPYPGMTAYVLDTNRLVIWNGTAWIGAFDSGPWPTFTPVIGGGWIQGNGISSGNYRKDGRSIEIRARFVVGSTTGAASSSGGCRIGGFAAIGGVAAGAIEHYGTGNFYDSSTGTSYLGGCRITPGTDWVTVTYLQGALGTGPVTHLAADFTHPINVLAAGDIVDVGIRYETTT